MFKKGVVGQCLVLVLLFIGNSQAYDRQAIVHPVYSSRGIVATQDSYATQVGIDVLKAGGNAMDAAYAVAYALAVTHPQAGNLAGGGFMLIYDAKSQQVLALDYREKAALAATKDMFLNPDGSVNNDASRFSVLSAGVPGTVAGLESMHERFGSVSRKSLLKPAIQLAKKGIRVQPGLAGSLAYFQKRLAAIPSTAAIFYPNQQAMQPGDDLHQPDLARALKRIQRHGKAGFYEGPLAASMIDYIQAQGGHMTMEDLRLYQPKWRDPVRGSYRGYEIASMPPPSSGGIALIQTLNVMSYFPIGEWGHNSANSVHITAEILKHTYSDRAKHLGDSDFVTVPQAQLIDPAYAAKIAAQVTLNAVTQATALRTLPFLDTESAETTHFVIIDQYGNAVSNTYTLNFSFGNGHVVPGWGFFLNNEMDDFSAKPGVSNAYGLIGNDKNSIAPQKRMLSSMTPTLVLKDNKPVLITGSPGGSRIITTTLQIISNIIDHKMSIAEAVHAPRFHHQWLPDILRIESGFPVDTHNMLQKRGFLLKTQSTMGSAQSILVTNRGYAGSADPRTPDAMAAGL